MVEYVLIVAILNLLLGFTIAVRLGRRYRTSQSPWDGGFSLSAPALCTASPSHPRTAPMADAGLSAAQQPTATSAASSSAAGPAPISASTPPQEATPLDSLRRMGSEVEQFHERLATADDRLRECAENPQRNTVEACLKDLIEATEEYVQQRDQACQRLHELAAEQPGGSASQGGLEQALDCEAQHIQAAGAAAQAFDYDADLRHGCRHIIDETSRLLDASHHVREALARTMVGQLHNNPELLDPQAERDTITGALNRVGLDNLLAQWLRNDPQHQRRLAAGLVDLDQFGRINTEYGQRLGDRVLRAAAQILQGECPGDGEVARLCSHTFVVLLPEADTRTAVDLIERARQTIEHARLEYRQTEIRVTASCAITEFRADDSPATFLMRLDATLMEAKRYGRNRSFVQEGEYPTPVIPPTLSVAERTIAL